MARTLAVAGFGAKLYRGDGGGSEVFTLVAEVKDISGPTQQLQTEDATSMDSEAAVTERIATVIEAGTVSFRCNFLAANAQQAGLLLDKANRTLRNFRIVLPNATKRWSFGAFVTKADPSHPMKGVIELDVELSISGPHYFENHP